MKELRVCSYPPGQDACPLSDYPQEYDTGMYGIIFVFHLPLFFTILNDVTNAKGFTISLLSHHICYLLSFRISCNSCCLLSFVGLKVYTKASENNIFKEKLSLSLSYILFCFPLSDTRFTTFHLPSAVCTLSATYSPVFLLSTTSQTLTYRSEAQHCNYYNITPHERSDLLRGCKDCKLVLATTLVTF